MNQNSYPSIWCRHFQARWVCPRLQTVSKSLSKCCVRTAPTHYFVWRKFSFPTVYFYPFPSVRKCYFLCNPCPNLCPLNQAPPSWSTRNRWGQRTMVSLLSKKLLLYFNVLNVLSSSYSIQLFLTPNVMPPRNMIQPWLPAITMAQVCFRIYETIDSGSRFVCYFYWTFIDCKWWLRVRVQEWYCWRTSSRLAVAQYYFTINKRKGSSVSPSMHTDQEHHHL